ncbi:MAG: DNA repair protein RadA [Gammaproteobacteria bacterium]|nr:DNA repair protein RadA [Gammaproteobacteria bacterium]MCF6230349.1 DNA repair protein RadA [Gammaproteobacteria bacterium]
MAKAKTVFACTECGAQAGKWAGQCADCGVWNSLVEQKFESASPANVHPRFAGYSGGVRSQIQMLSDVERRTDLKTLTGIKELDRVLGDGLVHGAVVMLGGDPGIGKSTLLLQAIAALSDRLPCLYITGEESLYQVSARAQRLSLQLDRLQLLAETCVERILEIAQQAQPKVMVIDSIQTVYTEALQSAPGGVSQLRESAAMLVRYAKQSDTAIFLVGHVTKEGTLAGPRVLEHMVDTVLYFEGDASSSFRAIRAIKNRFGAVNELGMFAMTEKGLRAVTNPSAMFLSRHPEPVPGSVVMVTREGTRPLLVEVQALVDESHLANPRRVTIGLEHNRLAMLLAVLHRHGGIPTFDQDVFVNVVGGVRVTETAADLPVIMAVLSSLRSRPLDNGTIVFGEVGLSGEVRPVQSGLDRLKEAAKHGFKRAIIPKENAPKSGKIEGLEIIAVSRLSDALGYL